MTAYVITLNIHSTDDSYGIENEFVNVFSTMESAVLFANVEISMALTELNNPNFIIVEYPGDDEYKLTIEHITTKHVYVEYITTAHPL